MTETATATTTVAQPDGASFFDKTICLVLTRGALGTTRKAKGAAQTVAAEAVDANPEMIALTKRLFKAPEFKAIRTRDGEFNAFLDRVSLPSLLKSGTRAIPIPLVEEVDDAARQYAAERTTLVSVLQHAWLRIITEAQADLGPQLFDPLNYPSADRLPQFFYVEHRWIDYGVPSRLKSIKASIWKDERAKAEVEVRNAKEQALNELRTRFLDVVAHIVERLTPAADGKRKVFRNTLLGNVQEFIAVFPALNTAVGDTHAAPLIEKARRALDGIDPKLLRDDELIRQKVASDFAAIKSALDGMVVEQTRKISFDDELDEAV